MGRAALKIPVIVTLLAVSLQAQSPLAQDAKTDKLAAIDGVVSNAITLRPLNRSEVVLKPAEAGLHALSQTTDDQGRFSFSEVPPGRYTILVQRDGFLPSSTGRLGGARMPPLFVVRERESIHGFTFLLEPWGVMAGSVKFEDSEPAINVTVQLYREYFYRGLHGYQIAGSALTNDRGEYRMHGLSAGRYYLAAVYQKPVLVPGAEEQVRAQAAGKPLPELRYAVTFHPSSQKLIEAIPIRLKAGQELGGMDIFLSPVPTVRVRGRVISGVTGQLQMSPGLQLRRADLAETASINAPLMLTYNSDGSFLLRGVVVGPYELLASGNEDGLALSARRPLSVSEAGIQNLEVVLLPDAKWTGQVAVEDSDAAALSSLQISLEPRRVSARAVHGRVQRDGRFSVGVVPGETYDLFVLSAPDDVYLKSVRIGTTESLRNPAGSSADGLRAEEGDPSLSLQVVLSGKSGQVQGRVLTPENTIASGANVMLLPDPPRGHVQFYKNTWASQEGLFSFRGVAPGRYVLLAWLDEAPCEVYDPDALEICRSKATTLDVGLGQTSIEIRTAN